MVGGEGVEGPDGTGRVSRRFMSPQNTVLAAIVTALLATVTSGGGLYSFREVSSKIDSMNVSLIEIKSDLKADKVERTRLAAEVLELRGQVRDLEKANAAMQARLERVSDRGNK